MTTPVCVVSLPLHFSSCLFSFFMSWLTRLLSLHPNHPSPQIRYNASAKERRIRQDLLSQFSPHSAAMYAPLCQTSRLCPLSDMCCWCFLLTGPLHPQPEDLQHFSDRRFQIFCQSRECCFCPPHPPHQPHAFSLSVYLSLCSVSLSVHATFCLCPCRSLSLSSHSMLSVIKTLGGTVCSRVTPATTHLVIGTASLSGGGSVYIHRE